MKIDITDDKGKKDILLNIFNFFWGGGGVV
jgi:hypothetical protein